MPNIQILNPDSLGKPLGQYSQLTRVKASEFLFIAGQVGTDKDGKAPPDFDAQCGLVFANIGAALSSQGARFASLVEFTTYLVHAQDIAKFMAYRTREFPKLFKGGAYPPNTLLIIDRLVREEFLISERSRGAVGATPIERRGAIALTSSARPRENGDPVTHLDSRLRE